MNWYLGVLMKYGTFEGRARRKGEGGDCWQLTQCQLPPPERQYTDVLAGPPRSMDCAA